MVKKEEGRGKREHLLAMTNAETDRMTYNSWIAASTLFMLSDGGGGGEARRER